MRMNSTSGPGRDKFQPAEDEFEDVEGHLDAKPVTDATAVPEDDEDVEGHRAAPLAPDVEDVEGHFRY